MFIARHEFARAQPDALAVHSRLERAASQQDLQALYRGLLCPRPDPDVRVAAAHWLRGEIAAVDDKACELPCEPQDLLAWMKGSAQVVTAQYAIYLEERRAGAPRRYFANRAHALYFLRAVAPTKLVDGAWLYGLTQHWRDPRLAELIQTYLEELGDGAADKNHVVLYRQLLAQHGLDQSGLGDEFHVQGLVQLALGWNAQDFLPELVGFNLGYEQLPLHLLITAYELNELGLDPYYFTLHVTVDNSDTGHARRACQAVFDLMPQLGDATDFWQRVRRGSQLGGLGKGTTAVIEAFDIEQEVLRIFTQKSVAGHGAHSDYCRVAGRSVNDWLAQPGDMPQFLAALAQAGWIRRGAPADQSRFWGLLQGDRAEMFGVFSAYELQVVHDWLRGDASADGAPYAQQAAPQVRRAASFRATHRLSLARGEIEAAGPDVGDLPDPDVQALKTQLPGLDGAQQMDWLVAAMAPSTHWTPAGLLATRMFMQRLHR